MTRTFGHPVQGKERGCKLQNDKILTVLQSDQPDMSQRIIPLCPFQFHIYTTPLKIGRNSPEIVILASLDRPVPTLQSIALFPEARSLATHLILRLRNVVRSFVEGEVGYPAAPTTGYRKQLKNSVNHLILFVHLDELLPTISSKGCPMRDHTLRSRIRSAK